MNEPENYLSPEYFYLRKAIKAVSSGELWLDRKTMSNILTCNNLSKIEEVKLTKAEREVVSLICGRFRNKEIASKLEISEKTVKSHCNRIYKKVGVTDRLQLATHIYKAWPDWYLARNWSNRIKLFDLKSSPSPLAGEGQGEGAW